MSNEDFPSDNPLEVAKALAGEDYHNQEAERQAQTERLHAWFDGDDPTERDFTAQDVEQYLESRPYEDDQGIHDPSTDEVVEPVDDGTAGKRMRGHWGNRYFENRRAGKLENEANPAELPLDELFNRYADAEIEGNKTFVDDYGEALAKKLSAKDVKATELAELQAEVEFDSETTESGAPQTAALVKEAIDKKVTEFHNQNIGKSKEAYEVQDADGTWRTVSPLEDASIRTNNFRARLEREKEKVLAELRKENAGLVEEAKNPQPQESEKKDKVEAVAEEPRDDEPDEPSAVFESASDEDQESDDEPSVSPEADNSDDADDNGDNQPETAETDVLPIEEDDEPEPETEEMPQTDEYETEPNGEQVTESRWARLKRGFWKHMYETPVDMSPMGPTIQPDRPFEEWYADKQAKGQEPGRVSRAAEKTAEKLGEMADFVHYVGDMALINTAYYAGNAADTVSNTTRRVDDAGNAVLEQIADRSEPGVEFASRARQRATYLGQVALDRMGAISGQLKEFLKRSSSKSEGKDDESEAKEQVDFEESLQRGTWVWNEGWHWED